MKLKVIQLPLLVALALGMSSNAAMALELYSNNVDADLPGSGIRPNGWWAWNDDGVATSVFTEEVTETGGVGGSQAYRETTDSTSANGTSWYFVRGFGNLAVFADEGEFNRLAGGVEGSNDPSRYRFSADVKIEGNGGGGGAAPLYFGVSAIDVNYEAAYGINVNGPGDTDLLDGATVYESEVNPTISTSGEYVTVSFTLDQGPKAVDSDILPEHRVFSNMLALQWYVSYNSGAFGYDADNAVSIDNVRIDFLEDVELDGDYNADGNVDAADYVVWRKSDGTATDLPNDGGLTGNVGPAHYDLWKENFGTSGGGSGGAGSVPEPTSLLLAALVVLGCLFDPRLRRGTDE